SRRAARPKAFASGRGGRLADMTIAELSEDRVVEGVYAVRTKRKLRTKRGASYLALELAGTTGRIDARVWKDVELLDGRFGEGDAVRVLGRVERFRDRLQLDVRSLEATDVDPTSLTPAIRRDADELAGFLEFLVGEISHSGLSATVQAVLDGCDLAAFPATPDDHHSYAGGLLEHTVRVRAPPQPPPVVGLAWLSAAPPAGGPGGRAPARPAAGPPARASPPRPRACRPPPGQGAGARAGRRPAGGPPNAKGTVQNSTPLP